MIAHEHYAFCDVPGCELNERRGTESHSLISDLRRDMREGGWKRKRGIHGRMMDLCPDCADEDRQ